MPLYDISRPLANTTAVWPGDAAIRVERYAEIAKGSDSNVSSIRASVHSATHVDATIHYDEKGTGIEALDLELYVGQCVVLDVRGLDPIGVEGLPAHLPERVLLRTDAWEDSNVFPKNIPTLTPGAARALGERGVRLIGVDVPSVDKVSSRGMPIHHALHEAGVLILESIDLRHIDPGEYELVALPVLIPGSDGSFVRAVLRR